jgi:hypothetical protein
MHRFHHHNGVIDDNANRQYQGKERQQIDRKTQHLHKEKSTHQRHGHCQRRNKRRAEILQEEVDDQEYQNKGLKKRPDHFVNGSVQEA